MDCRQADTPFRREVICNFLGNLFKGQGVKACRDEGLQFGIDGDFRGSSHSMRAAMGGGYIVSGG